MTHFTSTFSGCCSSGKFGNCCYRVNKYSYLLSCSDGEGVAYLVSLWHRRVWGSSDLLLSILYLTLYQFSVLMSKDKRRLMSANSHLLINKQELEIKKMAKTGNKEACKVLAKQLVQLRKQKTRTYAVSSKVTSMSTQTKLMNSQMKMAGAMSTTAKVRSFECSQDSV